MSDELVTWLRAQIDEDERAARAWLPFGNPTPAQREHIARHDPGRVLREVEAKRRILRELAAHANRYREGDPTVIISAEGRAMAEWSRYLLRLLALPYADREGFRPEWRSSADPDAPDRPGYRDEWRPA